MVIARKELERLIKPALVALAPLKGPDPESFTKGMDKAREDLGQGTSVQRILYHVWY